MISSSNFFKKSFFTIEGHQTASRTIDEEEDYGPWSQEVFNPKQKTVSLNRKSSPNRYFFSSMDKSLEMNSNSNPERYKNRILQEKSLIEPSRHRKQLKKKKAQEQHLLLPPIRNSVDTTKVFDRSILNLDDGLNFITKNNQNCLKKFVAKKFSEERDYSPRFQIYKKCLIAARKLVFESKQNTLIYNG